MADVTRETTRETRDWVFLLVIVAPDVFEMYDSLEATGPLPVGVEPPDSAGGVPGAGPFALDSSRASWG
jgi:hypothetical protein